MDEGYLIVNATSDNIKQVELLVHSIKAIDPERPITVTTFDDNVKKITSAEVLEMDSTITNKVLQYFKSLHAAPYDKTIALLPDQLLTYFNVDVWEALRGMGPVVIPKHKYSFSGEVNWPSAYWMDGVEEKTFNHASVINAVYLNKQFGSMDVMGLAIDVCSSYDQQDYLEWLKDRSNEGGDFLLPVFPEYLWEQWVISFLRHTLGETIRTFDFVKCIDLSLQENNYWNPIWSKEHWTKFLTYWVTETGQLKIENFIQLGLVKYQHDGWLSEENLKLLKNIDGTV